MHESAAEFLDNGNFNNTTDMLIEFAKLHREAILKSVIENVELETYGNFGNSINKDSILNAYPVTLIK